MTKTDTTTCVVTVADLLRQIKHEHGNIESCANHMAQIANQYESAIEARDQAHERMRHLKSVLDYCLIHDVDPVQAQLSMPSDQNTDASHKTKGGGIIFNLNLDPSNNGISP